MFSAWFVTALLGASLASDADPRWAPFLGCWSLVEDEVRRPLLGPSEEKTPEEDRPMGLVCLAPEGSGVRLQTFSGEEAFLEESLISDGQKREIERGKCRGWQQLDWSKDASILFTRSELLCEENRTRSVTGVSMLLDGSSWVEISSMESAAGSAVLIRRFRAASDEVSRLRIPAMTEDQARAAVEARFKVASKPLAIEDVIEMASRVAPEVVEASLLERGGRIPVDSQALVLLSDSSVPPGVIDLLVALAFPEEFAVERTSGGGSWGYPGYDPFFDSAFAYPYYFAPFGYYYWYAPWNPIYPVPPVESPGATVGRAVEGRGYTRVTRVEPFDSGERRARQRGESGSDTGGYSDKSSGSSSSSGGSVSREGYSRGGSEGGTARPRKQ
jgi:hypothetical protein